MATGGSGPYPAMSTCQGAADFASTAANGNSILNDDYSALFDEFSGTDGFGVNGGFEATSFAYFGWKHHDGTLSSYASGSAHSGSRVGRFIPSGGDVSHPRFEQKLTRYNVVPQTHLAGLYHRHETTQTQLGIEVWYRTFDYQVDTTPDCLWPGNSSLQINANTRQTPGTWVLAGENQESTTSGWNSLEAELDTPNSDDGVEFKIVVDGPSSAVQIDDITID